MATKQPGAIGKFMLTHGRFPHFLYVHRKVLLVCLLLVIVITACINPIASLPYQYKEFEKGCIIQGYTGKGGNLRIPSSLFYRPVSSIGVFAFQDNDTLTSLTVPDGVITIQWNAFSGCSNLKTVHLPDSVNLLGSGCFSDCENLVSVTLPETHITFEESVFSNCPNLVLRVRQGSSAHLYARDNEIPFILY